MNSAVLIKDRLFLSRNDKNRCFFGFDLLNERTGRVFVWFRAECNDLYVEVNNKNENIPNE